MQSNGLEWMQLRVSEAGGSQHRLPALNTEAKQQSELFFKAAESYACNC